MPISGAPTSRATISATSRSRPKKNPLSSRSNDARPLNGQTTMPSAPRSTSSRSRAACRSTTVLARSSSAVRRLVRSEAARRAAASRRCAASLRAHSLAQRWTRCGTPPLASTSRAIGTSASSCAYDRAMAATPSASRGASVSVVPARTTGAPGRGGGDDQHRQGLQRFGEVFEQAAERFAGAVEVVDHDSVGRRAACAAATAARAVSGAPAPEA